MVDISYIPRERQKKIFWLLGILVYFPFVVKLVLVITGFDSSGFLLTATDIDFLLVLFMATVSLVVLIYLFYTVAGPFLAASHPSMPRRSRSTKRWFGFDSRRSEGRTVPVSRMKPGKKSVSSSSSGGSKTPLVAHCEFCDEKSYMPYICRRCGMVTCDEHRLPEKHRCPFI